MALLLGYARNQTSIIDPSIIDHRSSIIDLQVALADLAFVHLGLNDPVSALAFAGRLLETKPSAVST